MPPELALSVQSLLNQNSLFIIIGDKRRHVRSAAAYYNDYPLEYRGYCTIFNRADYLVGSMVAAIIAPGAAISAGSSCVPATIIFRVLTSSFALAARVNGS